MTAGCMGQTVSALPEQCSSAATPGGQAAGAITTGSTAPAEAAQGAAAAQTTLCQNLALAMSAAATKATDLNNQRKLPRCAAACRRLTSCQSHLENVYGSLLPCSCPALDLIGIHDAMPQGGGAAACGRCQVHAGRAATYGARQCTHLCWREQW